MTPLNRRRFLKTNGGTVGALAAARGSWQASGNPRHGDRVVGAGAFGG
jgi:hypothetical protein